MPTTITTSSNTQTAVPAHRVWLRENWGDAWEVEPFLYCDTAAIRAAPEKSSAVLHYDYGWISQPPGGEEPAYYPPLEIEHWYCKVEIDWVNAEGQTEPFYWYGIVYDRDDDAFGSVIRGGSGSGSGPQPTGRQKFACFGMEVLLERETIRASTILLANGSEVDVGRPLAFNHTGSRAEDHLVPNRTPAIGEKGACLFHTDLTTAKFWATNDVLDYLLAYRAPANAAGNITIPWQVDPALSGIVPGYDQPRIELKTDTLKEVIDHKLLSRKRLVSYVVTVNEGEEEGDDDFVQLEPFTFTADALTVPTQYQLADGSFEDSIAIIAANTDQIALDFSQAFDVQVAGLRKAGQERYDQVIVRGALKTSTFTLGWDDLYLTEDWDTGTLETAYETAASTQPDYASSCQTWGLQRWRNQLFRSADLYHRVYRWFAVYGTWAGKAADGEGGASHFVFPLDDDFATSDTFYRPGLLFRRHLPLYHDRNYTGTNIAEGTVTGAGIGSGSGSGGMPEYLPPMGFLKILSPLGEGWGSGSGSGIFSGQRYQHVEKLSECAKTDKHALGGGSFTASLRMRDRNLGVEINVHGAPQHMIAASTFSGQASDEKPVIDYRNNLILTVACDADRHVEAVWPKAATDDEDEPDAPEVDEDSAEEEPQVADICRTLLIDLSHLEHGAAIRLDYVLPGTVVGIADGVLQRSNGGYVRDDRGRLLSIAQVAWKWYQQERNAFTLRYAQIDGQFAVGQFITTIGPAGAAQQVNTPITSIEWDLVNATTTLTTGFAELDFGSLI